MEQNNTEWSIISIRINENDQNAR